MSSEWYSVFKVKSRMAFPDPHMPPGRFHHCLFVQTGSDGSGTVYHVVGDITSAAGMTYESEHREDPQKEETFHSKELLGYAFAAYHPQYWRPILSALPTPPQQKASNPSKSGQVEPFKEKIGDYQYLFYEDGEEREPLWKCTEWVEQYAIPALRQHGLIQVRIPDVRGSAHDG